MYAAVRNGDRRKSSLHGEVKAVCGSRISSSELRMILKHCGDFHGCERRSQIKCFLMNEATFMGYQTEHKRTSISKCEVKLRLLSISKSKMLFNTNRSRGTASTSSVYPLATRTD
jgi:hypothetical protein